MAALDLRFKPFLQTKEKDQALPGLFLWCSIADVKITLPDDPEADVKEIRELLDGSVNDNNIKPC